MKKFDIIGRINLFVEEYAKYHNLPTKYFSNKIPPQLLLDEWYIYRRSFDRPLKPGEDEVSSMANWFKNNHYDYYYVRLFAASLLAKDEDRAGKNIPMPTEENLRTINKMWRRLKEASSI